MEDQELDRMSFKDLRLLELQVKAAIARRAETERARLKEKLEDLAAKAGFSVKELFDGARNGRRRAAIKYRHKDDPSLKWTGRGRRPRWLVKAGGDIERFRVG